MQPKEVVELWVEAFNQADIDKLSALYAETAVNHQTPETAVRGRAQIQRRFEAEFERAEMVCIVENIFQDGEWAILEWSDPVGLRGCGFFQIRGDKIEVQRGYWDKLSFLRLHNLPIPHQ